MDDVTFDRKPYDKCKMTMRLNAFEKGSCSNLTAATFTEPHAHTNSNRKSTDLMMQWLDLSYELNNELDLNNAKF